MKILFSTLTKQYVVPTEEGLGCSRIVALWGGGVIMQCGRRGVGAKDLWARLGGTSDDCELLCSAALPVLFGCASLDQEAEWDHHLISPVLKAAIKSPMVDTVADGASRPLEMCMARPESNVGPNLISQVLDAATELLSAMGSKNSKL